MSLRCGLHTNENVLVAVDVLVHSRGAFLGIFLMAFMMGVSLSESPVSYIIYNIVRYVCMGLFAIIFLWFCKRHTLAAWRISAFFSITQILAVIFLDPTAMYFPYVIAVLSAFESMLYWRPKMFFDVVEVSNERRLRFKSISQVISEIVKIIMPVILGISIIKTSYTLTGFIILAISVFQLILSILFRPTHRPAVQKVNFVAAYERILKNPALQKIMLIQLLRGILLTGSAYVVIVSINLYQNVSSSLDLGIFTAIGSLISIITIILFQRIAKRKGSQMTMLVGLATPIILLPIVCYLFPGNATVAIVFYVYVQAILETFFNSVISVKRLQDIMKKHLYDDSLRIEIEAMSELALTVGRVFTLTILLFMIQMGWQNYILILAIASSLVIIPFVRMSLSRRETKQISTSN